MERPDRAISLSGVEEGSQTCEPRSLCKNNDDHSLSAALNGVQKHKERQ